MKKTADAVIIGAGIAGASVAYQLANRGMTNILVVEKESVGSGATQESASVMRTHDDYRWRATLEHMTLQIYKNWEDIIGTEISWQPTGALRLANEAETEKMKKNVEICNEIGLRNEIISAEDVKRLHPFMNVDDIGVAFYEPDWTIGSAYDVTYGFSKKARELGAEVVQDVAVTAIKESGGRIAGVETTKGIVESPIVVLTAGAWSKTLAGSIGVELPVFAERYYNQIASRPLEIMGSFKHFVCDFALGTWFRPEGEDLMLMGDEGYGEEVDPDTYEKWIPDEARIECFTRIAQRAPVIGNAPLRRVMVAADASTPDGNPVLGKIPGVDGAYVSTGFSILGYSQAPAAAICLAELILDGKVKSLDEDLFTAWRMTRFAENDPLKSATSYKISL